MKTDAVTPTDIARSVWAVPPLAHDARGGPADTENRNLVRHIEAGGVSTILWGGNANVYAMTAAEVEVLAERLPDWVADGTWAIPSVGPDYGKLREHARVLARSRFPAALLLPQAGPRDVGGVERAVESFVQDAGVPAILYIRVPEYLPAERVAKLLDDGTLVAVKYAAETGDFTHDPYLEALAAACPRERIVSGIGELAAIPHLRTFALAGFTAGAVCIAPRRATAILAALQGGDRERADTLAEPIRPLEELRARHGPIRVIHEAVSRSGIADMGVLGPHFSPVGEEVRAEIADAARALLEAEEDPALRA